MIFLSNIANTFRFQSSQSGVDHYKVTLYITTSLGTLTIAEDLVPVLDNGYYFVVGLKEFVQAYMEQNNYSLFTLTLGAKPYNSSDEWMEELDDITVSEEVLYNSCKVRTTAATIVNRRFMTRRSSILFCLEQNYTLRWEHGTVGDTFNVVYQLKDGTSVTSTFTVSSVSGSVAIGRTAYKDAISAYAKYGSRELTIYYMDMDEYLLFDFRNVFNKDEYFAVPASIECDPSTEYEEASIDQVSQHYDIEHGLEYRVKTGSLTDVQRDTLIELCRSRKVKLWRPDEMAWVTVLVNNYELPESSNPNTPVVAELTLVPAAYEDRDAMLLK